VLQNLGKAERTTDDVFTENVLKVEKQQEVAGHLQKELKKYVHAVQSVCQASKTFHAALLSTYESEWTEEEKFQTQVQSFELLWTDYLQSLQEKVVAPMATYLQSFPQIKAKVTKRGRKMVDFDNSRHQLEVLQGAKKKDEVKINKATEDLSQAKKIYDQINEELHQEVPDFYNSRVTFYAGLFSSLFGAEYTFHHEQGKVNGTLGEISTQLGKDFEQFAYHPKRPISKSMSSHSTSELQINGEVSSPPSSPPTSPEPGHSTEPHIYGNQEVVRKQSIEEDKDAVELNGADSQEEDQEKEAEKPSSGEAVEEQATPQAAPRMMLLVENGESNDGDDSEVQDDQVSKEDNTEVETPPPMMTIEDVEPEEPPAPPAPSSAPPVAELISDNVGDVVEKDTDVSNNNVSSQEDKTKEGGDEVVYSSPPPSTEEKAKLNPPPGTKYMVEATHKYSGEDVDELSFEPGEIIYVIHFDNEEEQDDGWQMGIKASDGLKGVFPENFTKPMNQ